MDREPCPVFNAYRQWDRASFLALIIPLLFLSKKFLGYFVVIAILIGLFSKNTLIPRVIGGSEQSVRTMLWKMEYPLLKKDVFLGDGPGTYPVLIKQGGMFGENVVADRPHNLYLNIWQVSGLLSLIPLFLIVIENLKHSRDNSIRLGVIAYLINSFFTDSVLCVTPYFLIFLGAMSHEYNEKVRHRGRA